MARPLRIEFPGAFYHVITHGNGRLWLFRDDNDCIKLLSVIGSGVKRYKVGIHAFVLMRNHIHFLLETPLGNLSHFMRQVLSEYGIYYNKRYKRGGSVFKSRYSSYIVQKDKYYHTLIRYIYLNPIKAGIVDDIRDYRWSSLYYLINKDKLKGIPWFNLNYVYSIIENYQEILKIIKSKKITGIKKVYRFFVADEDWAHKVLKKNKHKLRDKNISGVRGIEKQYKIEEDLEKIWDSIKVNRKGLIQDKRNPYYKAMVYTLKEMFPLTNKEIAKMMNNTENGIAKMYNRMKKHSERYNEALKIVDKIKEMSRVKT